MTALDVSGLRALFAATIRRERVRVAVWLVAILTIIFTSAASIKALFPTQADLDTAAAASDNPAIIAFNGPAIALDTIGGQVVFQIGAPGLVIVGLMAVLVTNRLTRKEEESGLLEMVRSLPVGRHAPMVVAMLIGLAMSAVLGVGAFLSFVGQGLDARGSLIYGLQLAGFVSVFVGITIVAAQVTENARVSGALAGAVLALAFIIRAIGDMGSGALSWFSPMGWVQKTQAFGDERFWPLLLPVIAVGMLVWVAVVLLDRRDLGSGLFASRPGPADADESLLSPLGLAFRLQRGSVLGWSIGLACLGVVYGVITTAIEDFIRDNPTMADFMAAAAGSTITESYLATSAHGSALIASGFAVQSILRLRSEETAQHAEPVLATAVSRTSWVASHSIIALVGSVAVLASLGLGLGISAALTAGDGALVGQVITASLGHVPALWTVVAVGVLLIGLLPRYASAVWVVSAGGLVVGFFGTVLRMPAWLQQMSPFEHIPLVPVDTFTVVPLLVLTAISALLLAVGMQAIQRRDIG